MNDRMRKGCCCLLTLLLTLVLVIPAYGQETLDALAAAQGCTAETLLQSQGCKCVTERMGGDVRQTVPLAELTKPICHAIRVHRLSVILCEHKAPHSSGITANEE